MEAISSILGSIVTIVPALALCAGIIYNWVLFQYTEPSLFMYLTFQDHLQSALFWLPGVLGGWGLNIMHRISSRNDFNVDNEVRLNETREKAQWRLRSKVFMQYLLPGIIAYIAGNLIEASQLLGSRGDIIVLLLKFIGGMIIILGSLKIISIYELMKNLPPAFISLFEMSLVFIPINCLSKTLRIRLV